MRRSSNPGCFSGSMPRRTFLGRGGAALAGLSLGPVIGARIEDQVAYATQNVPRSSSPSQLRITDLRVAVVTGAPFRCPLIRIDTNQDICGYGEVRDGASHTYALLLKSRILGENPCNVERIFKRIRQFGHHGRQGGGVSGVEMALWDLAGKAYGVPVYQLLGGRHRDRVRLYADTPDGELDGLRRRVDQGFTFLKCDCGIRRLLDVPGALTHPTVDTYWQGKHPFTAVQLSDKGAALLAERFAQARDLVGWQIPIAADHFGHIDVNSCIRLGKALQPFQVAWLEDMVPWEYTDMLKEIKHAVDVPLLTGEDIYTLDGGFRKLIDERAVDMVHPDLATAGGILETKKIGDYAEQAGIAMAMHFAGTPVSFMANVHCAAATENFIALEHHSVDITWWEDLVTGIDKPLAMGELFNNPHEWVGLISERLIDFIRVHISQVGGLSVARKIAALGEWFNVRTAWHGPGDVSPVGHAANAHLDLAVWNFGIQEAVHFSDKTTEVFPGSPRVEDGYMYVNEAPGLGVDIDEGLAARYPLPEHPGYWMPVRMPDGTAVRP